MKSMKPHTIRRALAAFPRITQRFWTWLSGLALPDETPRKTWSQLNHFLLTFSVFCLAAAIGLASTQHLIGTAAQSLN